jgi:hypothetical protein
LRHFQRIFLRFFQTRELRFIGLSSGYLPCRKIEGHIYILG